MKLLPPLARCTQRELLDEAIVDQRALAANLADLRVVNRWFGGSASVLRAVAQLVGAETRPLRILDVATGSGDTPLALRSWVVRHGIRATIYACDLLPGVLAEARRFTKGRLPLLRVDALRLPCASQCIDLITCAQTLHHFDPPGAVALLRECAAVARMVVFSDLRRSRATYWGARALTSVQRSPISRHDGPLSAIRAYTLSEVKALCAAAGLNGSIVRADGPCRLVMSWRQNA